MIGHILTKDSHYTSEDKANEACWERNMLALAYAHRVNGLQKFIHNNMFGHDIPKEVICGWYNDIDNGRDGWHRVISLDCGKITFSIPDNFDVGDLPKITPNWIGNTDKQKWNRIADMNKANIEWER